MLTRKETTLLSLYCPYCNSDVLDCSYMPDNSTATVYMIKCGSCGLKGWGATRDNAYENMVKNAPFKSVEQSLDSLTLAVDDLREGMLSLLTKKV